MSKVLIVFPPEPDAKSTLMLMDDGRVFVGELATHPSGRPGQGFALPDGIVQGHGIILTFTKGKKVLEQRGILWINNGSVAYPWTVGQEAAFAADDFRWPESPPTHSARAGIVRTV